LLRSIPNLITIARLCLVPLVLRAIWNREYEWALLWCAVAGVTDALDGFLARLFKATSRAGAYLDPIADKLLLSGVYFMLGYDRVIPWWLTAVVFGRDALMLVSIGIAMLTTDLRNFPPTIWGKVSTAIQIVTALMILLKGIMYWSQEWYTVERWLIYLTVVATCWSAAHYLWVGIGMLRRQRHASAQKTPN
jgi:cardiolipin synthase